MNTERPPTQLVFVTGLDGTGKSFTVRMMEDMGFRGIDNLPLTLVPGLVDHIVDDEVTHRFVVAIEPGASDSAYLLLNSIEVAQKRKLDVKLVLLEADERALASRRLLANRRRSASTAPQPSGDYPAFLATIREHATLVLDTASISVGDARDRLRRLADALPADFQTPVEIQSFGFKYGVCGADMVFDVRFLPNPYYVPELRRLCGQDEPCASYVLRHDSARYFVTAAADLLQHLVPEFSSQGRSALSVGIGCTGGQHRSVAISEAVSTELGSRGVAVSVAHRESQSWETDSVRILAGDPP